MPVVASRKTFVKSGTAPQNLQEERLGDIKSTQPRALIYGAIGIAPLLIYLWWCLQFINTNIERQVRQDKMHTAKKLERKWKNGDLPWKVTGGCHPQHGNFSKYIE